MAAVQSLLASPTPSSGPLNGANGHAKSDEMDIDKNAQSPLIIDGGFFGEALQNGDLRIAVIIYGQGQEHIVAEFAEVLGKPVRLRESFSAVCAEDQNSVVGIPASEAKNDLESRNKDLVVAINAHCIHLGMPPDLFLSAHCDYEFLYTERPFFRRDLSRFISFILGQINHHNELMAKPRTLFISTTFPDVRAALPNLDILTVGSDAVELRVDLLREPIGDGKFAEVPSLKYVGEQLLLLRQRTELPIIFTTRCTNENGRFPMDKPELYYEYLYRAIQWGVEYIDVELWLPEELRRTLYEKRGNSRIMSAFHDFSGTFKWPSEYALDVFERSMKYADIIKMIAIINDHNENFELEYFRSKVKNEYPGAPPFSAVNMGEVGQFSRTLNKTFTPITHPLLPLIAAPGQLSAAEINNALAQLGQIQKKSYYGISSTASRVQGHRAPFYEKCFNELGLPHQFAVIERQPNNPAGLESLLNQRWFGGAYLDPGLSYAALAKHNRMLATLNNGEGPLLTEAVRVIGIVDTIVVKNTPPSGSGSRSPSIPASPRRQGESLTTSTLRANTNASNTTLIFDNASWKGILSTLTRDLAPSAYSGRTAVVVASSPDDAAPVIFAMKALKIAKIYTVGFRTPAALARNAPSIEQFVSMESLQRARSDSEENTPFLIVSALGPDKSNLVAILLRVFGNSAPRNGDTCSSKKVFLDLAGGGERQSNDSAAAAEKNGFAAYGAADVAAFTTVESMRLLVGQNVPYSFVRLASGNGFGF